MRLPSKLAFTAFHVAVAGTLACSAKTDTVTERLTDAASDVPMEAAADVAADVADSAPVDSAPPDAAPTEASILDASTDAPSDGADECAANYFCGPAVPDASCPGYVCDISGCSLDAGCEPFV